MLAQSLHRHAGTAVFAQRARRKVEELLAIVGVRRSGRRPAAFDRVCDRAELP